MHVLAAVDLLLARPWFHVWSVPQTLYWKPAAAASVLIAVSLTRKTQRCGVRHSFSRVRFPGLGFYSCGKWRGITENTNDLLVKPASFVVRLHVSTHSFLEIISTTRLDKVHTRPSPNALIKLMMDSMPEKTKQIYWSWKMEGLKVVMLV